MFADHCTLREDIDGSANPSAKQEAPTWSQQHGPQPSKAEPIAIVHRSRDDAFGRSFRRRNATRLVAVASCFAVSITTLARAQPSASDKATARSLMDEGDRAADVKDYATALKAYAAAHAMMKVPSTGVEVARMQAALGRWVEALDAALEVTRMPVMGPEPKPFTQARIDARALAAKLSESIPSLVLRVRGAPANANLEVKMNGASVPTVTLGLPRQVNPGRVDIRVTSARCEPAESTVTIRENEHKTVELALVCPETEPQPSSVSVSAPPIATSATTPLEPSRDTSVRARSSGWVYVGFGTGVLGAAVGSVAGVLSLSKASKLKASCDGDACPQSAERDIGTARTLANVSNVGFAVGLLGVGLGIYGLLNPPAQTTDASGSMHVRPVVGLGYSGIEGTF